MIGNQKAPLTFAGIHITESNNMYYIDPDLYMSTIEKIPSDAAFSKIASVRVKLA